MKPRRNQAPGLLLLAAVLALALAGLSCNAPPALLSEFNLNGFAQESIAEVQAALPDDVVGNESPQSLDLILPSDNSASDAPSPTPFQPAESTTLASLPAETATVSPAPTGSTTPSGTPGTSTASPSPTTTTMGTTGATWTTTPSPTITWTSPPTTPPPTSQIATASNTPVPPPTSTNQPPPPSSTSPPPTSTPTHTALPPTPTSGICNPSGNGSLESSLIQLINQERQSRDIGTLSQQSQLTAAARVHSEDMACNDFVDHRGSDGLWPWDRARDQGYTYSAIAENIFAGSSSAQSIFNGWMNSPGHRDNMLNPTYTEIGVGYQYWTDSTYKAYTTAVFAKPR
ncbi:MAG: CAP domain-containing protein [Anaerolineales bacterium]|nr:MAG: CAP domain-containing protein [Anaerolineales bacterium]